jgi:hypothetical protein
MVFIAAMKRCTALCVLAFCALAVPGQASAARERPLPALTRVGADALTRALDRGALTEGQYALERARSLFRLGAVRREFGQVAKPSPRNATPILRDLTVRLRFLRSADRARAAAILARPSANQTSCDPVRRLCFHWPNSTSAEDADLTMTSFAGVWDLEVLDYGYRRPLSDDDGFTDIYLRDIGNQGLFGYCASDDPNASSPSYPYGDVSAYCVVDDDFIEFGTSQTPQEFREVTAAHEFFHAIQFAYDLFEDLWLMEGTAMLMEDQYADGVNDNVNYLDNSVLTSPPTAVDTGEGGFQYGAWIWWRFLVERFDELGNPLVIRQIWERADASADRDGAGPDQVGPDDYSLQAVRNVIAARGRAFKPLFGEFARVNRFPARFYQEGRTYPAARVTAGYTLRPRAATTGLRSVRILHLASRYYSFTPGRHTSAGAKLRVSVDLPFVRYGSRASLLVRYADGTVTPVTIPLDSHGDGSRTVPFGRGTVRAVFLVLTNASPRLRCGEGTMYSCEGDGLDDLRYYRFRARLR